MAKVFDEILTSGIRQGQVPARSSAARKWFRDTALSYENISEKRIMGNKAARERMTSAPEPGSMYFFKYDAKHKKTLPYWDRFPLIFPIEQAPGGFRGINFHYLPYDYRAVLMDALYDITNNKRYDETTKLMASFDILKSASRYRYFEPCVKRYLFTQVRSQFLYIYPAEWDIALFLPMARFQKRTKEFVWSESRKRFN